MKIYCLIFIIILVSISIITTSAQNQTSDNSESKTQDSICTNGWYITGYFLPVESEYASKPSSIIINEKQYYFKIDFLNEVKIQGWGKTNSGNYLGWDDGRYYFNDIPLDSTGKKLVVGSIAVDPNVIEHGKKITIPTLPFPWNKMIFDSNDIGPAIIGKHIDVYAGEGLDARKEAFRITGFDNSVCNVNDKTNIKIDSPLKQFISDIPLERIQCKEGLELVFKVNDHSPACVKPLTISRLIDRGWGMTLLKIN